jgi:hypothetical protein
MNDLKTIAISRKLYPNSKEAEKYIRFFYRKETMQIIKYKKYNIYDTKLTLLNHRDYHYFAFYL